MVSFWGIQNSANSDFDEIYTIYVNFTEEHNGLAPESLGGHLRRLGGGVAAPFQILREKKNGLAVTLYSRRPEPIQQKFQCKFIKY